MTELDSEIPGLADELIAEFGKDIIYQKTEANGYDTATAKAIVTGDPINIKAIVEPYRGQRMLAGLVEAEDLKVTAAATSFADGPPTPEDLIAIDGIDYKVKNVMPTYSGDLVAIYELQVGR